MTHNYRYSWDEKKIIIKWEEQLYEQLYKQLDASG